MRRRSWLVACCLALLPLATACAPATAPPTSPPEPPPEPTPGPTPLLRTGDQNGSLGTCPVFPADNPWNTDVSAYPEHPDSDAIIARIQADGAEFLHADFGGGGAYGSRT